MKGLFGWKWVAASRRVPKPYIFRSPTIGSLAKLRGGKEGSRDLYYYYYNFS
jgi:hypothetical protein